MKHLLQNKKGFTLIEMIIGMAVLSILIGIIAVVFTQMIRISNEVTDMGQLEIIAAESMSDILNDLRVAKEVTITDPTATVPSILNVTTNDYTAMYRVDDVDSDATTTDDMLLMREYVNAETAGAKEVLDKRFYMGYNMSLIWTISGSAAGDDLQVTLTLNLLEPDGDVAFEEEYVVRPSFANAGG